MSEFNSYAVKVYDIAKAAVAQLGESRRKQDTAVRKMHEKPLGAFPNDPRYQAAAQAAQLDFFEARSAHNSVCRNLPEQVGRDLSRVREELGLALDKYYMASPNNVDEKTIELLKSGILRPTEYVHLVEEAVKADNATMARIIGKYAEDALEAARESGARRQTLATLAVAIDKSKSIGAAGYLERFDVLADLARRCSENPSLFACWDKVVGNMMREF